MEASVDGQKIKAAKAEPDKPADNTLPDPTRAAKWTVVGIVVLTVIAALVMNLAGWAKPGTAFKPSKTETADFALFAGFYVLAQVIAAALTVVSPVLPPWTIKGADDATTRAAQVKADRGVLQLALAALAGAVLSCLFGLYFLEAVGIHTSHTIDAIFTGATVAGGAKPLHDFAGIISNKKAPKTGTTA
jgi:hypothetical protein